MSHPMSRIVGRAVVNDPVDPLQMDSGVHVHHRLWARNPEVLALYQLTALYNHPDDVAAFDTHYDTIHAPLASKVPGLQRYTVSRPGPDADGNPPPYHLVAVLDFTDEASFGAGMGGPEGQAAVADLATFAGAGVTLLTGAATTI